MQVRPSTAGPNGKGLNVGSFQPLGELESEENVGELGESVDEHSPEISEGEPVAGEGEVIKREEYDGPCQDLTCERIRPDE